MSGLGGLWTGLLEPGTAAWLLVASFGASFVTAAMGIGGGVLLLAAMASLLPPAALIPVHGVIQLGSNAGRALVLARHVSRAPLGAFALGAALGVALGGLVAVDLPPPVVQIGVGLFVIWTVLATAPRWLAGHPAVTGAVSSFLTMFFGASGVFVASFTRSLGLTRQGTVGTHAALMVLQHGLKVAMFAALGFAYGPWLGFIAAMALAGFLGTLVGRQVLEGWSDHRFRRGFDAILVLLALRLIWGGGSALWAG